MYLGPATRAINYFEELGYKCPARTNPADFLMDVISGIDRAKTLKQEWDDRREAWIGAAEPEQPAEVLCSADADDPRERRRITCCRQTYLYFCRAVLQQFRPRHKLLVDYSMIALMGLLIGVSLLPPGAPLQDGN